MDQLKPAKKGQLHLYSAFIASRWFETIEDFINLEMCSPRFLGNMSKFHYNPISLTRITREWFDHLKTLYIYDSVKDDLFEDDERIIAREYCKIKKYDLFTNQIEQLQEWSKKQLESIVFDSNVDKWDIDHSQFEKKIMGKGNLTFLIEDHSGNKFGYYLSTKIQKYGRWIPTSASTFLFSLENKGKSDMAMKYEIRFQCQGYWLYPKKNSNLIELGDITLYKENFKNKCYCDQDNWCFNYHGRKNAFCGKQKHKHVRQGFTPKRILVCQMV